MPVRRKYRRFFNIVHALNPRTIHKTVAQFSTVETVSNVTKRRIGRRRTARSEENVQAARKAMIRSPRKSSSRLSMESNAHRTSVHRLLTTDLHLFPNKTQSQSQLTRLQTTNFYSVCSQGYKKNKNTHFRKC